MNTFELDWNWFFSAIAQSTAAITGIFSAFIITKIINNQSNFLKNNNLFTFYENEAKRIKDLYNWNNVKDDDNITMAFKSIDNKNSFADINYHINKINHFIDSVSSNQESSKLISFSIVVLFLLYWIGVFLPLCFLPYYETNDIIPILEFSNFIYSAKAVILLLISLLFSVILIVFFFINFTMKYDKNKIEKLKQYMNKNYYSDNWKNECRKLKN